MKRRKRLAQSFGWLLVWRFSLEQGRSKIGGAKGIRTPDLLHAMQTRYQLRHSPASRKTALSARPARWNVVSIQAPRPCVVLDHHDAATMSPRCRHDAARAPRRTPALP